MHALINHVKLKCVNDTSLMRSNYDRQFFFHHVRESVAIAQQKYSKTALHLMNQVIRKRR